MRAKSIIGKKFTSFNFISLKAKLIISILVITLGCASITGLQALRNGQQAHNSSLEKQLVTLREAQSNALNIWAGNLESQVAVVAAAPTVVQAMSEFSAAYHRLEMESFDTDVDKSLSEYYKNKLVEIIPEYGENELAISRFLPKTHNGKLLQYDYISNPDNSKHKAHITSANSNRYYDGVHAHYHRAFRKITENLDFDDMYLISLKDGAIVYSVEKKPDFATRLISGAYEATSFGHLFNDIRMSQIPDNVKLSDYGFYVPNDNKPTAFIGTTLFDKNQLAVGVLIFAIGADAIDNVLGQQANISEEIGKTTETLIIGADRRLRSNINFSRSLSDEDNPVSDCYARGLQQLKKMDSGTANQICRTRSASLLQTLDNDAVSRALEKKAGIGGYKNYLDEEVIVAYAPWQFGEMTWAINTQILASEAHEPIYRFQRNLLVSIILIVCVVTFLSMLIAYLFVNPISQLTLAAKKLGRGETDIEVKTNELDEYGELGVALQQTGLNLDRQQKELHSLQVANTRMLRNTLPDRLIKQHLSGKRGSVEQINHAALLYLIIEQPVADTASVSPEGMRLIAKIMERLYQISAKNGAEYIRVIGGQLIVGFGFKRSRMDYTSRSLHCAKQLHQEIHHFNQQHEPQLAHRIGIHSGLLNAGIMYTGNERHFSYDLVGAALNGARHLASVAPMGQILLSDDSFRQISGDQANNFDETSLVLKGKKGQSVWSFRATGQSNNATNSQSTNI